MDIRAVLEEEAATDIDLGFDNRPRADGTVLHVEWVPPISSNYGGGIHPTLWSSMRIRVAPLAATDRNAARKALRQHALPELADWISAARCAPEVWTLSRHSRDWRTAGHSTVHRDDGQPY